MPTDNLNEREFELINIVGAYLGANQRDLSQHMDMSLGMTNMIIRRLVSKGYIRIRQLNKRKVEYILTPKGFTEKIRKSIKYTLKTISSIGLIKSRTETVILSLYRSGERNFYILGSSDLVTLVEIVFKEAHLEDCKVSIIKEMPTHKIEGVILVCQENVSSQNANINRQVDILNELGKDSVLMGQSQ